MEGYLKIWDVSSRPVKTDKECKFMDSQVTIEIAAGRFLPLFGADLLRGMYSPTVHMVPKQNLTLCGLWLTTPVVSLTSTLWLHTRTYLGFTGWDTHAWGIHHLDQGSGSSHYPHHLQVRCLCNLMPIADAPFDPDHPNCNHQWAMIYW